MPDTLTIKVTARDVTGATIGVGHIALTVAVQVQTPQAPTQVNQIVLQGAIGMPTVIKDVVVPRLAILVDASDFTDERAVLTFDDKAGAWQSTNPHIVPSGSKTDLAVAAVLGVVRFTPLMVLDETKAAKPDDNPGAALIEPRPPKFAYRALFYGDLFIARLSDPLDGKSDADDWNRFAHQKSHVVGQDHGTFVLLEYGFPPPNTAGRPRFLVAVWYPSDPLANLADVNVYYSPNTGVPYPADTYPFAKAYPYQLSPKNEAKGPSYTVADLLQRYTSLAQDHLLIGSKIVYQMLAAGKNSIVVMPIQPAGQWDALATRTCMWRLVLEAIRFGEARRLITRRGKVGELVLRPDGATTKTDDLPLPDTPFTRSQIRVTVSAYSAGLGAILTLIGSAKPRDDGRYRPSHFGSDDRECQSAWSTVWDVDGAFAQLGGFKRCVQALSAWQKGDPKRVLRMYHSEDTVRADQALGEVLPSVAVRRWTGKVGFVDQGSDKARSTFWVLISNSMLTTKSPADEKSAVWPPLGSQSAHHMMPLVTFGHAWKVT